jgi:hypothetical protein
VDTLKDIATFKKDHKPTVYLGIVRALLKGNPVKKIEILRKMGVNITEVNVDGYYSNYFKKLHTAGVIKYNPVYMSWMQGPNYQDYLTKIFKDLLSNEDFVNKFGNFLVEYDSNSLDFIMRLE